MLQLLFTSVFVGAAIGGIITSLITLAIWFDWKRSGYQRKCLRRWLIALIMFIGFWGIGFGTGLLAIRLGYEP